MLIEHHGKQPNVDVSAFRDGMVYDAGKIGLWTKSDAQTEFDGLTVRRD